MQNFRELTNVPSSDATPLRVAGFGACMIAGYPYESGGLFEVACAFVEKRLSRSVQSHIVSLGGFPAPRAKKYLKRRVFDFEPDYVVIQFGATDAQCPIRAKHSSVDPSAKSASVSGKAVFGPPSTLTRIRWQISSLVGFILRVDAATPLSLYIQAIEHMVNDCLLSQITPIVLSPFVFGSRHSTRNAILYTDALHEVQSKAEPMILVDCIRLLSKFPRATILLNDGFHLSGRGHRLVGEAIGEAIVADVVRCSQCPQYDKYATRKRHVGPDLKG